MKCIAPGCQDGLVSPRLYCRTCDGTGEVPDEVELISEDEWGKEWESRIERAEEARATIGFESLVSFFGEIQDNAIAYGKQQERKVIQEEK